MEVVQARVVKLRRFHEPVHDLLDVRGALDLAQVVGVAARDGGFDENSWQQSSSGRIEIS